MGGSYETMAKITPHPKEHTMKKPKLRNVNMLTRMSASPLADGSVFWLADGTRCTNCGTVLPCDPEWLANGTSFRLICPSCHCDAMRVD